MLKRIFPAIAIVAAAITLFFAAVPTLGAATAAAVALSGRVSSQEEGAMESVSIAPPAALK